MTVFEEVSIYLLFCILVLILYPQFNSKLKIYASPNSKLHQYILKKCNSIKNGYYFPTIYLGNGYLQSLFNSISSFRHHKANHTKVLINTSENEQIIYDVVTLNPDVQKNIESKNTLIVMLIGVTSSSKEPYVENFATESLMKGYSVVVYNERIYNNQEMRGNVFPKKGYYDETKDFFSVVEYLKKQYDGFRFFVVGHSLGANNMTKYLGMYKEKNPFECAVSIANPFNLDLAQSLHSSIIARFFCSNRKSILQLRKPLFENPPDHIKIELEKAFIAKNSNEFDDAFSKHMYGCSTITEYYKFISSENLLENIDIPLFCINANDDPCIHKSVIPYDKIKNNPNIFLIVTNSGGHVGWFEGFFNPKRWYIKPAFEFLDIFEQFSIDKKMS